MDYGASVAFIDGWIEGVYTNRGWPDVVYSLMKVICFIYKPLCWILDAL
jgi:hypothetical protein